MNKPEKEVRDFYDETERAILKKLEQHYKEALKDINKRLAQLLGQQNPQLPEIINHAEYQRTLKGWIQAALDRLHAKEYDSIAEYLDDSYKNGFVGTMYTLHHQDMPFLIPIDESMVIKSITLKTHLSEDLYTSLGVDLNALRKTVQSEITRGIATGLMYKDIARNIANASGVPMRRAKTIARTEAGRIQEQATMDAANEAKAQGADLVKQWSAIRDGRTRDNHRYLDGQVRELDEYFEVEGHQAMHPHDFGIASEDCNCRCTDLIRPRSEMDETEYHRLQEIAGEHGLLVKDSKEFGHKVSKNFADFKEKYLKAAQTLENTGKTGYNKGAINGAYNDSNDPYGEKRDAHAERFYESLRNSKKANVVSAIATNAGVEEEYVSRMYDHLLVNEYKLDGGIRRFDTDYNIAQSLQRLREGKNIQAHDLLLIQHEALEYDLMNNEGMNYEEAHAKANEKFNYAKALMEFLLGKDGE